VLERNTNRDNKRSTHQCSIFTFFFVLVDADGYMQPEIVMCSAESRRESWTLSLHAVTEYSMGNDSLGL